MCHAGQLSKLIISMLLTYTYEMVTQRLRALEPEDTGFDPEYERIDERVDNLKLNHLLRTIAMLTMIDEQLAVRVPYVAPVRAGGLPPGGRHILHSLKSCY
ncbi:hypothetical protein EVAR_11685_1 [Eumeta japonica]|uniref:Uncharacterized protein n=1 Tax=Eumeta variegata TaxID=151549 RepID=A0A4C1U4W7_EUMVA|nr:hypothetical protein EVAR_11685_1 [Eumeta japonica]